MKPDFALPKAEVDKSFVTPDGQKVPQYSDILVAFATWQGRKIAIDSDSVILNSTRQSPSFKIILVTPIFKPRAPLNAASEVVYPSHVDRNPLVTVHEVPVHLG